MIALIDYGAGNLASVRKALAAVGATSFIPDSPSDLSAVAGIIVPGVGHFATTAALAGWCDAVRQRLLDGVPLLGICLGMQWLFDGSDEAPGIPGLGVIRGTVTRLPEGTGGQPDRSHGALKIPHVGWNTLEITTSDRLLHGVRDGTYVYFTHSFAAPVTGETSALARHGSTFAAAVASEQVFGVQFHPEKSGDPGLRILRNFVEVTCSRSA